MELNFYGQYSGASLICLSTNNSLLSYNSYSEEYWPLGTDITKFANRFYFQYQFKYPVSPNTISELKHFSCSLGSDEGFSDTFLESRVSSLPQPVPEPSIFLLFGFSGIVFGLIKSLKSVYIHSIVSKVNINSLP